MASEAEAIIDIYTRHADAWDTLRGRSLFFEQPWLQRFADHLPQPGSILDIGCGAAEPLARYFIEQGHSVTGIDASQPLIERCKDRFPGHEWIVGDMRGLELDRTFEGLLAWDSFFHLCPDHQRQMFPIFRRHSARGSVLMFTSGTSYGEAIGSFQGEPLYHGSLDAAEYRQLLAQNGFSVLDHAVEDPTCGDHTIWLVQMNEHSPSTDCGC